MLTISSGPRLMADRTEFEKSMVELPGEGRTYTSKEEGTKIWRNKTLRKYHEPKQPVPKQHRERRNPEIEAIEYRSDRSDRSDGFRSLYRHHRALPATDDQKMVSAEDLDKIFLDIEPKIQSKRYNELEKSDSYSYIPTVRDVAIQCNRKKTNRHLNTSSDNDSYVRVIKSSNDGFVTAYSDVPQLKSNKPSKRAPESKHEVWNDRSSPQSEAIYSKVDKTKKKSVREDINRSDRYHDVIESYPQVIYRTPMNERRPASGLSHNSKYSGSEYSTNTNRTLKNKTKGIGFNLSSGIDGPKVDLPRTSPKLRSRSLNRYEEPTPTRHWTDSLNRKGHKKEVKQEILEETISISNASSDDFEPYHPNRSFDEFLEPKSQFKEIDKKRKEISYVNELPNQRRLTNENDRPVDEDYRRGMSSNIVVYPSGSETSYSTLTRFDRKKKDSKLTDFTPPPRQAYTLDRRHLKERQQKSEVTSKPKEVITSRLNKSTADLTEYSRRDDLRGGLANAYKNRQEKRPSSLNRMTAIREGRISPSGPSGHSTPIRYLSHSHLNSAGNSLNSSSESDTLNRHKRHYIHDREPIVMYIPAVSHHNKRAEDEPDRLSGILRPSSQAGSTASSRKYGKKVPKSSASDLTPSKPRDYSSKYSSNYGIRRPQNDEELDQVVELKDTKNFGKLKKGKSILSRRHSIPKDTKFPWLQKLRSKVKFKE